MGADLRAIFGNNLTHVFQKCVKESKKNHMRKFSRLQFIKILAFLKCERTHVDRTCDIMEKVLKIFCMYIEHKKKQTITAAREND